MPLSPYSVELPGTYQDEQENPANGDEKKDICKQYTTEKVFQCVIENLGRLNIPPKKYVASEQWPTV